MTDRTRQPAYLLRRLERAEAHRIAAEQARDKAQKAANEMLHEVVDLKLRLARAMRALQGDDE